MLLLNAAVPCLVQLWIIALWLFYRMVLCFCGCCSGKLRVFIKLKMRESE